MTHLRTIPVFIAKLSLLLCVFSPSFAFAQTTLAPTQPTPQAQPAGTASAPGATPTTTPTTAAPSSDTAFVPLTQLPGLTDTAATTSSLPAFLNQLYKICIGAAAVFAVIQIMVAGVQFMTSQGSVSSNSEAKSRIQNAVIGLILVLSPTIVFSIINPDILRLDLNFAALAPPALNHLNVGSASTTPGQFQGADTNLWQSTGDPAVAAQRCAASGGTLSYSCRKKDESGGRVVGMNDTCNADEDKLNVCKASAAGSTSGEQCQAQYEQIKSIPIDNGSPLGTVCSAPEGFISVPHGCCVGSPPTGNLCCAKPKTASRYLLAYYKVMTNTAPKASCYLPSFQFYATEASCKTDLQKYSTQGAEGNIGKPTIIKACELTPAANYIVPAPNGLAAC